MRSFPTSAPSNEVATARHNIARVALNAPVLPLVTATLPLAEQFRRTLLSKCKQLALGDEPGLADAEIWRRSPAFWAKDKEGRPQTGHGHAFFLPTDEDGDGRLDHVAVFARMDLGELERQALGALRLWLSRRDVYSRRYNPDADVGRNEKGEYVFTKESSHGL